MGKELKLKTQWKPSQTKIELGIDYVFSQKLPQYLNESNSRIVIITDTEVEEHYREFFKYFDASVFTFPAGEESKTRETKAMLEDHLLTHNYGRDTVIVGLGGGVVADLSGFLAATYLRGVPHLQIPTSLLAMVDASLGGKTAINTPYGKNTIGAFHPASEIWIDGKFLQTLPKRQWINGTVELIKAGMIESPSLFETMLSEPDRWKNRDMEFIMDRIFDGLCIKEEIVLQDPEEERGIRRVLNFGHTFGHAIELLENFEVQHGEAVAIGILVSSFISREMGHLSADDFSKIEEIFSLYQIPLRIHRKYDIEELMKVFVRDKKTLRGTPRFVLIEAIGEVLPFDGEFCTEVDFSLLEHATNWMYEQFYRPA